MATAVTRAAVEEALAECGRLGRHEFLGRYGFRPASSYFIRWEGQDYDSKAVLAVAHGFMPGGRPLRPNEISGGQADAVLKLERLGFEIVAAAGDPDWTWDEHVLALDLYMLNPASLPAKGSEPIMELSAVLNRLADRSGVPRTPKFRNPNGVYMKLMNFRRLDPAVRAQGRSGLSRGAKGEEAVWAAYAQDPPKLRAAAAAIRLAVDDVTVPLTHSVDDYEAEEGAILLKLHRSRERDRKLIEKKKAQALAKLGRLRCEVCEFDFGERYGPYGFGFIEAHHRKPVSSLIRGEKTRLSDLALVCANCHRMLHRGRDLLGIEGLRAILGQGKP